MSEAPLVRRSGWQALKQEFALSWKRLAITFLAGTAVLFLIRVPKVEDSILGEPDREMLETAFRIRSDTIVGASDPTVMLDIDDQTLLSSPYGGAKPGVEPNAGAPRALVSDLLRYVASAPKQKGAKAVVVDVDLGAPTPGDEAGVAKLHDTLAAWAANPDAPTLIIAREAFPPSILGLPGKGLSLPVSPFDDIVEHAPNIYWSTVKVLANERGVVQEFVPFQCVHIGSRTEPLYSATLLAYGAMNGRPPDGSPAGHWLKAAPEHCEREPDEQLEHGEVIDYQLSLGHGEYERVWPDLPTSWPGFRNCGDGDRAVFRRLSAGDVAAAGAGASPDLLCSRLVIIGGTNQVSNDYQQTPMHQMAGSMILVNAVRGLQMSRGGLRQAPLLVQEGVLLIVSLAITVGFGLSRRLRHQYKRFRSNAQHWRHRVALIPLNPVVLNWIAALLAHGVGIGFLLLSLKFGYWGFLSAPAFGAAAAEAIQDFTDEDEK